MRILGLVPSSRLVKNVIRDMLYGCWCSGKRIGGATVPPMTMLSVASVLREAGHDVGFLDALAEQIGWDAILRRAADADVVFVNSATMSVREDAELLLLLKQRRPDLRTIVFGAHPTFLPESALSFEGIDTIVRGEPEEAMLQVADALRRGESVDALPGVYTRASLGRKPLEYAPARELERHPFLDVSLLPPGVEYFNPIVERFPYITTETTRGCPARCTFCTAPFFYGKTIRAKSVERVLDEVESYLARGYREVYFRDETFTYDRRRTRAICEGILQRGLDVRWIANARIGNIPAEDFELMRRAGCHYLKFGVESGVQEILDRAHKGIRAEQVPIDFSRARAAGIDTHGHFMLGLPGETRATVEATLRFLCSIAATSISIGICTPFPGTPLFHELSAAVPELADGIEADFGREHYETYYNERYTGVPAVELAAALRRGYRRFYLRPRYLAWRLRRLRNLDELKRTLIAGVNVLSFSVDPRKSPRAQETRSPSTSARQSAPVSAPAGPA